MGTWHKFDRHTHPWNPHKSNIVWNPHKSNATRSKTSPPETATIPFRFWLYFTFLYVGMYKLSIWYCSMFQNNSEFNWFKLALTNIIYDSATYRSCLVIQWWSAHLWIHLVSEKSVSIWWTVQTFIVLSYCMRRHTTHFYPKSTHIPNANCRILLSSQSNFYKFGRR